MIIYDCKNIKNLLFSKARIFEDRIIPIVPVSFGKKYLNYENTTFE